MKCKSKWLSGNVITSVFVGLEYFQWVNTFSMGHYLQKNVAIMLYLKHVQIYNFKLWRNKSIAQFKFETKIILSIINCSMEWWTVIFRCFFLRKLTIFHTDNFLFWSICFCHVVIQINIMFKFYEYVTLIGVYLHILDSWRGSLCWSLSGSLCEYIIITYYAIA
jgi:hypothetical protein